MTAYIAKRLVLMIPTVLIVSAVVFLIMRIIPGDPAVLILSGPLGSKNYTQEQLDSKRAELGTDKPLAEQYGRWIWGLLRLDFGRSFVHRTDISDDLKQKLPITLQLTVMAFILSSLVALPLGLLSAMNQDRISDYVARFVTIGGVSIPDFWTGILVIYFLVLLFNWLPPLGYVNLWNDPSTNLQQLIFPAIALSFFNMAFVARLTRSSMLEVLRQDYIRTARSKGLVERLVIVRHGLRNALLPVVTLIGWQFGILMSGVVIIENIFLVPGLGRLLLESISQRDYAVTQAVVMIVTLIVLGLNLITDILYSWLDPRIRYQE